MIADLRYFNSLELEVASLKSQLETQKTQFLNEIDRLSREYYYADHMNAILGVYTKLDEVTNLQCDYLEMLEKCECLEKRGETSSGVQLHFGVFIFKHITYSDEFVNVFVRIGFGSTIKLVSFDESQVVTFNSKFVYGFKNGDCKIGSRSDNTIGSPHGFVIHGIQVLKGNEKVKEVIVVENWRIDNSQMLRVSAAYLEEIARVLTSMDAATVLAGEIDVPTSSSFIPTAGHPATVISTGSEVGPTASPIVTRRKGKEVMVESDTPKKKKLQEQIDAQVARELEEQLKKEDIRMNEQIARDAEVARIHAEEEIQGMIDSLDKSNETIAKYLQEYQQPMTKKQKREYYMAVIKSNLGWRFKDFKCMTFKEIEAKFGKVWKQIENFVPIGSKEETERLKRREKIKEMIQLVPVEDVYVQALQVKHPIIEWKVHSEGQRSYWQIIRLGGSSACYQFFIDLIRQLDREDLNQLWALVKEYLSIRPASSDKEIELWVELKRMYEPDPEDQLWTLTQNYMHAPVEWKLYDLSRVYHVTAKDKEIFMLVEKDYPLRRGLALVMISYRLQVENYSQMAEDLLRKIYNIANTPRKQSD
nr:hypothetical protein [Tanacetum cinerariifolium]